MTRYLLSERAFTTYNFSGTVAERRSLAQVLEAPHKWFTDELQAVTWRRELAPQWSLTAWGVR